MKIILECNAIVYNFSTLNIQKEKNYTPLGIESVGRPSTNITKKA